MLAQRKKRLSLASRVQEKPFERHLSVQGRSYQARARQGVEAGPGTSVFSEGARLSLKELRFEYDCSKQVEQQE